MKNKTFALLLIMLAAGSHACAQDDKKLQEAAKAEAFSNIVNAKNYIFQADDAFPLKGNIIHLSFGYALKVTPDTIICNLPYYGQAYQANLAQKDSGYKFTSTHFDYKAEVRKKGGWNITIKPKDAGYGLQLDLTIQPTGSANLQITSNDRQSISYSGAIGGNL